MSSICIYYVELAVIMISASQDLSSSTDNSLLSLIMVKLQVSRQRHFTSCSSSFNPATSEVTDKRTQRVHDDDIELKNLKDLLNDIPSCSRRIFLNCYKLSGLD